MGVNGPPTGGRIGARIADLMAEATLRARAASAQGEQVIRQQGTVHLAELAERQGSSILDRWTAAIMMSPDVAPETKQALEEIARPKAFAQVVAILGMLIGAAFPLAMAAAAGFIADISQWSLKHFAAIKLSPEALARAAQMDIISPEDAREWARESGVQPGQFHIQRELQRQLLPVGEVLTSLNRGLITEDNARGKLRLQGFSPTDVDTIIGLRFQFPTPSDLVRMAVREVFSPDVAQRFGQYEGLPPQFVELAQRNGMSEQFATWYWAAHWDLPSITQGFTMLHRGVISESDLDLLLRALDVMPFWRDKLTEISYNPLTRVDTRRMYRMGVIDDAGVIKAYMDEGYNRENAERLLAFTKAEKLEAERELTKVEIVTLFEAQAFDRNTAASLLQDLGYSPDEATFILDLGEHRRERSRQNRAITVIRARYIAFRIDEAQATTAMDGLGVAPAERDEHLKLWKVEREVSAPSPPVTTLARFLKKEILTLDEFKTQLRRLGLSDEEIGWYVIDTIGAPEETE